jgi:hypothetical protein
MPHATLKIIPGVDKYKTQTQNEAAVDSCNLIRFAPEPSGLGLVQKLGGWARFWPSAMPSIPRSLWAWQNSDTHQLLAVGCSSSVSAGVGAPLMVIHQEDGTKTIQDITPLVRQDNISCQVTTTTTSNLVQIHDTGSSASSFDAVYIPTHISSGGAIIFGFYQVVPIDSDNFEVALQDNQGNPVMPTSAVTSCVVASFTTISASSVVTVALPNHGYSVGSTYPVLVETAVGGVTLNGAFGVTSVPSADAFTIIGQNTASLSATVFINSGLARYNFYVGAGPLPAGSGYGAGPYGGGGYGTGVTPTGGTGNPIDTNDWTLDNWGDLLIACPTSTTFGGATSATVQGGPLYYWSHSQNNPVALAISGGPASNAGFFVAMPQRQIIAYGCEEIGVPDPLLVRWCDVNNFESWNGTPTNFAGKYRLTRGSKIVGGLQVGQQGLLLTDVGAWTTRFIGSSGGSNLVYSFNEVARGCGLIAQKAMAVLGGAAYWMGLSQFWMMGTSGVQIVPCPVWDQLFDDLDTDNLDKIRMAANSSFGEIALYYPSLSGGTGDIDKYVKFNTLLGAPQGWDYGSLNRTAWIDQSVLGQPLGADGTTLLLQQHEVSRDADGAPLNAVFQTGFFVLQEGELLSFVDQVWPDMRWQADSGTTPAGQVLLTFFTKEYPSQTSYRTFGPFTLSQAVNYVTPRLRGRLIALQIESNDIGTFWRLGAMRYRFQPAGKFL